jgi:large subunit ribosomal protein L28
MAYKCEICGKATTTGNLVSHSNKRSRRTIKPNIQTVNAVMDGKKKKVKVCSRCLRSNKVQKAI